VVGEQGRPGIIKRFAPWLLAIVAGLGVGWGVSGLLAPTAPARPDTAVAAPSDTRNPTANPAAEGAAGPPIALAVSDLDCNWGADFDGYFQRAQTMQQQATRDPNGTPPQVVVRVPHRPWQRLTVGGIAAMPQGRAIIFGEPFADVRAALIEGGVPVSPDGAIAPVYANGPRMERELQRLSGRTARYGATMLYCGSLRS
jgi:hypothetical protein